MNIKLTQHLWSSEWILENTFPRDSDDMTAGDVIKFYRINDILIEELKNYPGVVRTSYDRWTWTKKEDAEKFLTYFIIKYTQ